MHIVKNRGSLLLILIIVSSFLLIAADTPKTDVTVNIEGNNNNLNVELIEKAKEEGIPAMTQEELEMLIKLQMKFQAWQQSQGLDVNVQVKPTETPVANTDTAESSVSDEKPVKTISEDSQEESQSSSEEEEDGKPPAAVGVILFILLFILAVYLLCMVFLF